jgi:prepilin-type N-terminal cleavage/methylation domain-containing protein
MRKNFKKNRRKAMFDSRQGFSLMEVMLVVFILGTTLTVFIQVISGSIRHSADSRDTIIAASLAQEGVELVKNIRDNNWADKADGFLGTNIINSGSYAVNYNSLSLSNPGTGRLKWNGSYYNTSDGTDTKFSRRIVISGIGETRIVTSYVIWGGSSFPAIADCNAASKCVYAQITLTKWGG